MAGAGLAAAVYVAYVGAAWSRYGRAPRPDENDTDALLDRFMPEYEVVERHHGRVAAPPPVTLAAACEMDLLESRIVRVIFKARELILGATPDDEVRPSGLLPLVQSLGWVVLTELPGREVVVGAVTLTALTTLGPPRGLALKTQDPLGVKPIRSALLLDEHGHKWSYLSVKRAQIAQLKAHLSQYLARVRRGDTVIVCDRKTPIARLVPYGEADDGFVVREPSRPTADLRSVPGVKPRRRVEIVRLLRESRDQR